MQRRKFLKSTATILGGLAVAPKAILAAESELDCGVWYDAEITDTVDGDTFDVRVYDNDTEYNVRTLGHDTPEKSGNTRYEKTEEWEFIESENHLEEWGNKATTFGEDELPVGTQCQIRLDCKSEEIDQYGRLLAKIRYDRSGDGTYDTVYNKLTVEEGYARVYAASMSNTDSFIDAQRSARENSRGLWEADDSAAPEWRNRDVAETFHPHTSSIRTTDGKVANSRVPILAEPEALQKNTSTSTVDYDSGSIPMVAVDEPNNLAYFGGVPINERWEEEASDLEHFVFVTNLIDYLHDDTDPSGPVLVDGGHHTFGQNNAVSAEDTAFYQRFLEGVGIELHSINTYGDGVGYSLLEARALVVSVGQDAWSSEEVSEIQTFLDNGGVVLLFGSGSEPASDRENLDNLAADLGTDLRLNIDDVRDDANNVGDNRKLLSSANNNTTDFDLWSAYNGSSGDSGDTIATDVLDADPDDPDTASYHTWTLSDTSSEFTGEVDTISVDYPSGTSLDGLTEDDVTVYMDRDGDGTVDEIPVNSDSYSGSAATFDLDGRYDTSVKGEVRVEINGVTNPNSGEYVATETLDGEDTYSVDAEFVVTGLSVTTDPATEVTDNSATLNGSLDDLDGAGSADVYFEWGPSGDLSNTTTAQTLSSTGSFSEEVSNLDSDTDYEYRAVADASDGDSATGGTVSFTTDSTARSDVLTANPNSAGSSSYHTWTLSDPSNEYSGEANTITVDYPSGTSLDGLTDSEVTVYIDRDGDGTVDEIRVNSDSYAGSTDTFDLDGRYDTSVEGEVRVEIDGVTNPDVGDYVATETLDGDDTLSVDAEFVVE